MLPSDFSKKPIAAGLLVALYGATALAQDAAVDAGEAATEEALEEVVVTGIVTVSNVPWTSSGLTKASWTPSLPKIWVRFPTQPCRIVAAYHRRFD